MRVPTFEPDQEHGRPKSLFLQFPSQSRSEDLLGWNERRIQSGGRQHRNAVQKKSKTINTAGISVKGGCNLNKRREIHPEEL